MFISGCKLHRIIYINSLQINTFQARPSAQSMWSANATEPFSILTAEPAIRFVSTKTSSATPPWRRRRKSAATARESASFPTPSRTASFTDSARATVCVHTTWSRGEVVEGRSPTTSKSSTSASRVRDGSGKS